MERYEILLEAKFRVILIVLVGMFAYRPYPVSSVLNPTSACWWEYYLKVVSLSHHA